MGSSPDGSPLQYSVADKHHFSINQPFRALASTSPQSIAKLICYVHYFMTRLPLQPHLSAPYLRPLLLSGSFILRHHLNHRNDYPNSNNTLSFRDQYFVMLRVCISVKQKTDCSPLESLEVIKVVTQTSKSARMIFFTAKYETRVRSSEDSSCNKLTPYKRSRKNILLLLQLKKKKTFTHVEHLKHSN